ncbi:exo-alpha-sialidase [Kitasatospora sp. NPDC051853]|uniref:exo-alpha-sialidase n=1 Tax=Kitasatospora sp. NPDC051853 TaxID=3364058 RepID=UPI00379069A2
MSSAPFRRPRAGWPSALAATLLAAATTAFPVPAAAVTPVPAKLSTPFVPGDGGYQCVRIPSLLSTATGTLLAFGEGRVRDGNCGDVGDNDLVLRRSTDGGRTWGPIQVLVGADDRLAHGNPAPVIDARSGRITLLYSSSDWNGDPAAPSRAAFPRSVLAVRSEDGGANWSAPAPQPQLKAAGWGWVSTGPGHGVQLTGGPHKNRLVVAGDHTADRDTTAGIQLYVSDDGGLSWQLGAVSGAPKSGAHPAEPTLAETGSGGLYVNARNSENTRCTTNEHRLESTSPDGGTGFAAPFTPVANLDTAPVFGSLLRLHSPALDGRPARLLYSGASRLGPNPLEDRRELAIRSSTDEGRSWQTAGTLITPGRSGYSDLARLPDGTVAVLYETGTTTPHGTLAFTAFTEDAMDGARTELRRPRTADTGPNGHGNHAVIHGGAQLGTRGSGKAMAFDGKDDHLRLVGCGPSLRFGEGDLTLTAWFRYGNTTGNRTILWAYGMSDQPTDRVRQFWLRAEPEKGLLRASATTDQGSGSVTVPGAYNDGAWHHVVFERTGGRLTLAVDGGPESSAAGPAGDLTPPAQFNIHIGARPDFPDEPVGVAGLFQGTLDDVRLFGRALGPAEAAAVRGGALDVANDQERVRLGFSTIW